MDRLGKPISLSLRGSIHMTTAQGARALALPPDVLATARELKGIYPPEFITRTLAELCVQRNARALSEEDVRDECVEKAALPSGTGIGTGIQAPRSQ